MSGESAFDRFSKQYAVVLTTFRRDGRPVDTAVNLAVDGDRAFMRTWSTSGKAKRLRNNSAARIAPSTARGRPTGPSVEVTVRQVTGDDEQRARRLLRRKHPVLQGVLVPLGHKLRRLQTVHYEVHLAPRPHPPSRVVRN